MNGRERILAALEHDIPDRVPVWIHAINEVSISNIGKLLFEGIPDPKPANLMSQEELLKILEMLFMIHEELEIDGFSKPFQGVHRPLQSKSAGLRPLARPQGCAPQ